MPSSHLDKLLAGTVTKVTGMAPASGGFSVDIIIGGICGKGPIIPGKGPAEPQRSLSIDGAAPKGAVGIARTCEWGSGRGARGGASGPPLRPQARPFCGREWQYCKGPGPEGNFNAQGQRAQHPAYSTPAASKPLAKPRGSRL